MAEIVEPGEQSPSAHIPFTPRAKQVLRLSLAVALRFGHNYIGTEHLLLGVIDAGGPAGAALAAGLGLTSESAREHMTAEFAEFHARRAEGAG